MKGTEFLFEANEIFNIEYGRAIKIASGLRKAGLYPDSRTNAIQSNVTCVQGAHIIRALALNLNPFSHDFIFSINEYKLLFSENSHCITDLAEALSEGGVLLPSKKGINILHHISFSLDRPRVIMSFACDPDFDAENEDYEPKIITCERVYGEGEVRSAERWSIVKKSALMFLSIVLTDSNHIGPDLNKAQEFCSHISTLTA